MGLRVERGGFYGRRALSPDEWLDREMKTLMASWKSNGGEGPYASRGVANIVHGINAPYRIPARRIREAHEKRVRHELIRRFGLLLAEYADRLEGIPAEQPDRVA